MVSGRVAHFRVAISYSSGPLFGRYGFGRFDRVDIHRRVALVNGAGS